MRALLGKGCGWIYVGLKLWRLGVLQYRHLMIVVEYLFGVRVLFFIKEEVQSSMKGSPIVLSSLINSFHIHAFISTSIGVDCIGFTETFYQGGTFSLASSNIGLFLERRRCIQRAFKEIK